MVKKPPNRLRIVDGELVMADGSDPRAYLRTWAAAQGIDEKTPLSLTRREDFIKLGERASYICLCKLTADERFALAA